MDTESIESGVLSGVEGTLPKAKAAFPPIKREKLADGSEVRKIPVPSHRYTPVKETLPIRGGGSGYLLKKAFSKAKNHRTCSYGSCTE